MSNISIDANTEASKSKNPKNTLFRFVTMRAPELVGDEDLRRQFVTLEEEEFKNSHFMSVLSANTSVNKKEVLQSLTSSFKGSQYKSKTELSDSEFYTFASWLMANRTRLTKKQIDLKLLKITKDLNYYIRRVQLWDNLLYQIITEKSPYIREAILSLLVAEKFVSEYRSMEDADDKTIQKLAQARIIIPSLFLLEEGIEKKENSSGNLHINSKELDKQLEIQLAEKAIEELQFIGNELRMAKDKYDLQNEVNRKTSVLEYNEKLNLLYKNAKTVEQKFTDKETGLQRTFKEYIDLEVPAYEFTPDPELEYITENIEVSQETMSFLKGVKLSGKNTASQAIAVLEGEISQQSQVIVNQAPTGQTIVNNGGILTQINQIPNTVSLGKIFSIAGQSAIGKSPLTLLMNQAPAGADVVQASYKVAFNDGTQVLGSSFQDSWVNGKLQVVLFLENLYFHAASSFTVNGKFILSDGAILNFSGTAAVSERSIGLLLTRIVATGNGTFYPEVLTEDGNPADPESGPVLTTSTSFGFRRLGIADYRKVEQEICCYVPGEVSHIENIMAREFKEKTVKRSRKTEDTFTSSNEQEIEKLTDTSTTDRFELNQEVASVIAKDMHIGVQAGAHWGTEKYGGNINSDFASNTSSEDSNSQAVTHAKDVTERALDRVVQKIKEERTSKVTEEFSEEDTHGFDNRKGDAHVSGVYRWVDKVYKNKVINYGKRLMYEFMVPEPSAFHNKVTSGRKNGFTEEIVRPIDPRTVSGTLGLKDSKVSNVDIYKHWAAVFNAEIDAHPLEEIVAGESFNIIGNAVQLARTESNAGNGKVKIPEGYKAYYATGIYNASGDNDPGGNILSLTIGNLSGRYTIALWNHTLNISGAIQGFENEVPVSYTLGNHVAGDIAVTVKCKLTDKAKDQWRLNAFNSIIEAYENKLKEFEAKLREAKATGDEKAKTNPGFYRQVENTILRKNCIAYMLGDAKMGKNMLSGNTITDLKVRQDAALDAYATEVKFLEQAFEWDLMSYNFYPFYWADKNKWAELYNPDEMNDPIFRAFLQSGMARVILTVRPGFEEAVNWFMATKQVWNGGQVPTLDDPLFISIVQELSETTGEVEETWETRVPTSLTIIQAGSMGLNVVNALPCNSECDDNLLFDSDGEPIRDANGNQINAFEKTDVLIGESTEDHIAGQRKVAKRKQIESGENTDAQDEEETDQEARPVEFFPGGN